MEVNEQMEVIKMTNMGRKK